MINLLENKKNLEKVLNKEKLDDIKTYLGDKKFQELADFYYSVIMTEKYKYKLFASDESCNMYKMFLFATTFVHGNNEFYGKTFNMNSLSELEEVLSRDRTSKVLIVECSLSDERKYKSIYDEIAQIVDKDNIGLWALNIPTSMIEFAPSDFKYYTTVLLYDIYKLQNKCTKLLEKTNIGVTSFFDTYYTDIESLDKIYSNLGDVYFLDKKADETLVNKKIAILNYKKMDYNEPLSLIRFNIANDQVTIIPTVILPTYSIDECKDKCIELLKKDNIVIPDSVIEYEPEQFYKFTMYQLSKNIIKKYMNDVNDLSMYPESVSYHDIKVRQRKISELSRNKVIFNFEDALTNFEGKSQQDIVRNYLKHMCKKEINNCISFHDIIKECKKNGITENTIYGIIANTIWDFEEFKASFSIKTTKNYDDCYIGGYLTSGSRANCLKYELNNVEYNGLFYYFSKTGNYRYFDTIDYMNYLDSCFQTDRFSRFAKELGNDESLFYEMMSIYPKKTNTEQLIACTKRYREGFPPSQVFVKVRTTSGRT